MDEVDNYYTDEGEDLDEISNKMFGLLDLNKATQTDDINEDSSDESENSDEDRTKDDALALIASDSSDEDRRASVSIANVSCSRREIYERCYESFYEAVEKIKTEKIHSPENIEYVVTCLKNIAHNCLLIKTKSFYKRVKFVEKRFREDIHTPGYAYRFDTGRYDEAKKDFYKLYNKISNLPFWDW